MSAMLKKAATATCERPNLVCTGSGVTECQKQTFIDTSTKKVVTAGATAFKISSHGTDGVTEMLQLDTFLIPALPARVIASEMLLCYIYNAYNIGPVSMKS